MVTRIEVYRPNLCEWAHVGDVPPGQKGSISQNLPDGRREIYIFEPDLDDSKTILSKVSAREDMEIGNFRLLPKLQETNVLAELKKGDEPYRLTVKTDASPSRIIVRFSHH